MTKDSNNNTWQEYLASASQIYQRANYKRKSFDETLCTDVAGKHTITVHVEELEIGIHSKDREVFFNMLKTHTLPDVEKRVRQHDSAIMRVTYSL